ncbi:MAG: hypothetical protein JWN75_549 [Candidatus Saccharibacteria bacterium]|nr:hypothetical protein [Candidatus Saccharibacteria bacterium]
MITRTPAELKIVDLNELQQAISVYHQFLSIRPNITMPGGYLEANCRLGVIVDGSHESGTVKNVSRDTASAWLDSAIVTLGFYSHHDLEPSCIVGTRFIYAQFRLSARTWLSGAELTDAESMGEIFE